LSHTFSTGTGFFIVAFFPFLRQVRPAGAG
jgi:hypothetical protein